MKVRMEETICDLCGSKHADLHLLLKERLHGLSNDDFTIVKCQDCGLLYLNPRPVYEDLSYFYPPDEYWGDLPLKANRQDIARFTRKNFPSIFKVAKEIFGDKCGAVLDIGCGAGKILSVFAEEGWIVHGIECSEKTAEWASKMLGVPVQVGTVESTNIGTKKWDLIILRHVLEHVGSPTTLLKQVRNAIKDDGLVYISVPNVGCKQAVFYREHWYPYDCPRHFYHFAEKTLQSFMAKTGFEPLHIEHDYHETQWDLRLSWLYKSGKHLTKEQKFYECSPIIRFVNRQRRTVSKLISAYLFAPFLCLFRSGSAINIYCRPLKQL